jgi:DNA-binding IclR family transcriptional regulator
MLITFSHEHIGRLATRKGETTQLAVREGRQAFFIDDSDSPDRKSLFGSAQLQAHTARTIISLPALANECVRGKADGFAYDDREYVEGVRCLAAPVRDRDGAVVALICISAPMSRLHEKGVAPAAQELCRVAGEG